MKQRFLSMAVASALILGFSSCNNDEIETDGTDVQTENLRIETEISTVESALRSTRAGSLSSFPEGSALSLFVTDGALGSTYPTGMYNNVKSEYTSGKWELTPSVKLDNTPATVFAFYPYHASYTDGRSNMNVSHTDQVDYMFGTNAEGQGSINKNNPAVRLRMKHALSLLQFKISKTNYPGAGKLTRIEVANAANRFDMASSASLNISSGELTSLTGSNNPAFIENTSGLYFITDNEPTAEKDIMEVLVLPVNKVVINGNIQVHFFIDGISYTYNVPMNTTWKQGTKYVHHVTLSATELVVDDITITDWEEGPKNDINLY